MNRQIIAIGALAVVLAALGIVLWSTFAGDKPGKGVQAIVHCPQGHKTPMMWDQVIIKGNRDASGDWVLPCPTCGQQAIARNAGIEPPANASGAR